MATQDGVDVQDSSTSTNVPVDCIDVASAGSNPASGHSARQAVAIGDGGGALQYASVSSGGSLQVNQACEINRNPIVLVASSVAGSTTEALIVTSITSGLVGQIASNRYTVTSGKILRVQSVMVQVTGGTTSTTIIRIRLGASTTGTIVYSQPIRYGSTAVTIPVIPVVTGFENGYEFASGTVLSFTQAAGSTSQFVDCQLIGYEYTPE